MVLLPEPDTPITISAQSISADSSSTKSLRQRRLVDQPNRLAERAYAARGQVLAFKHAGQDRALVRARHLEQHFATGSERRKCQGHPGHERLDMRLGHA